MGTVHGERKTLESLRHLYNHMTTMAMEISTPPTNPHSPSKRRHSPNMSIDLSDLPPLSQPTPPSNTLLITNLQALEIFTAKPNAPVEQRIETESTQERPITTRQRSGTGTLVYHPDDHGDSPDLPAIAVEDTSDSLQPQDGDISPMEGMERKMIHTARPPVELMEQ